MEGLIIMAILFIISTVLNGAKKKQQYSKGMPPFNSKPSQHQHDVGLPNQPERKNSLEDFASEVLQQLNDKTQQNSSTQRKELEQKPKTVNASKKEVVVNQAISQKTRPVFDGNRSSNRGATISSKSSSAGDTIKQNEISSYIPTTRKELVNAIITTEILGPPKAKQK